MTTVFEYHERTKHHLNRYARGPETLDWDDQPDPFRRFQDCPQIQLPMPGWESSNTWKELLAPHSIKPSPLNLETLGICLELAFGLSAWKQYGPDRWALRCNPSSGNLHPSEVYVISGSGNPIPAGCYHYVSYDHSLEQRCNYESDFASNDLLIGLSSIPWREAWKYGERAFRYCQLDAGHAFASLSYSAAVLGWRIELLGDYSDAEMAQLFGIDRSEDFLSNEMEYPEWVCRIHDNPHRSTHQKTEFLTAANNTLWQGKACSLKAYHMYHWHLIDEITKAAEKLSVSTTLNDVSNDPYGQAVQSQSKAVATRIIRQRRSAQAFDSNGSAISQHDFFRMLSVVTACEEPALACWPWKPAVHLCLFVHKVDGLSPGLYALPRSKQGVDKFKDHLESQFMWRAVENYPELYFLYEGDMRKIAKLLSCHQSIASDSAFSLAMVAEFRDTITVSSWCYRRLFWECGIIGQILYLEAETLGLRGTGIGCFFDDEVHKILGIQDNSLQSMYHFTVGHPLQDNRIQTLPAYGHLSRWGSLNQ